MAPASGGGRRRPDGGDPGSGGAARLLHGVASGEPTQHSLLLWTRATVDDPSAHADLSWEVAECDGGTVVAAGHAVAAAGSDHTVHVVVEGLRPGTSYTYCFRTAADECTGRTSTLPDSADRYRIGVVCCARWGWNDFASYGRLADDEPDLVLHLGDYIYEKGELPPVGPPTDPPHDTRTLADYRRRFAQHRAHPDVQRLHATAPMIAIWDDHEVANNAPTDDDEAARARRACGMRAWLEWMPAVGGDPHRPLDRELSVADLVDLTLVDARYSGRNPTDTEGPATPQADEPLLNDEQWTALERRVTTAGAAWHLLANQVQVGPTRLGWLPSLRRPFVRPLVNPDQWDGFPEERERLYDLLSRGQSSTVVLSGDLHSAWFRLLRHRRRHVAHELTCPAVAGESYAFAFRRRTHLPAFVLRAVIMLLNRGIELVELDRHGHLLLDVTRDRIDATFVLDEPVERRTLTIDRGTIDRGTIDRGTIDRGTIDRGTITRE